MVGTAVLLFAIVTARYWASRGGPPWSDQAVRIAIIGVAAGLAVLGVSISPLGRRSGGHLNPGITLGLWLQRVTGRADLAGYCTAQIAGGIGGVATARVWGAQVARPQVDWAVISPAAWMAPVPAAGIEAAATFAQLLLVFAVLASGRYHQWAPLAAGVVLTASIITVAPLSGGGFSPVRGLAPDVVADAYPALWIYFAGPVAGSVAATVAVLAWGRRAVTGKLCHDPAIDCRMRCGLPHRTEVALQPEGADETPRG